MADKQNKQTDNVPGKFYVDDQCTACGLCADEAPDNFQLSADDSYAFVFKQPENEDEKSACISAMDSCPVEAIGNDG